MVVDRERIIREVLLNFDWYKYGLNNVAKTSIYASNLAQEISDALNRHESGVSPTPWLDTWEEHELVGGQIIRCHSYEVCAGPHCAIHRPSNHHMIYWPQYWRYDRGIMERICVHGIGHPDPDDSTIRIGKDSGIHGCDHCCVLPKENNEL